MGDDSLERGALYLVATPIGNLGDLSPRALDVLRGVDWIAAEDTRHTRGLLARFAVRTPLFSAHAHNERARAEEIAARLAAGETGALVVDAGSPGVSDPGERVVRAAIAAGRPVRAVPGPSAVIAALSVSGLPTAAFTFAGFLPARAGARDGRLRSLLSRPETLVVYEAPHRVRDTLEALARLVPGRPLAACRELTKLHEEVLRGDAAAVLAQVTGERERGEWVLVVGGSVGVDDEPAAGGEAAAAGGEDAARARFIAAQVASGVEEGEARRRAAFVLGPESPRPRPRPRDGGIPGPARKGSRRT
jgi:16S rRNA (cytidine1402-2'-O)-methyltransferase